MGVEQRSVSTRRSGSRARIAFMSCPAYGLGTWWRNATPRAPSSASTCSKWPSSSRASCESVTGSSRRSAYLKRRLTAVDAAFFSQWAWSRRISSRCAHARSIHARPVVDARLNMARSYHVGGARQNGAAPPARGGLLPTLEPRREPLLAPGGVTAADALHAEAPDDGVERPVERRVPEVRARGEEGELLGRVAHDAGRRHADQPDGQPRPVPLPEAQRRIGDR